MLKKSFPIVLGLVFSAFAVFSPKDGVTTLFSGEGERYIVELNEKPTIINTEKDEDDLLSEQDSLIKALKNHSTLDKSTNQVTRFTSAFNGFSMKLTSDDVKYAKGFSNVKAVYKEHQHSMEEGNASNESVGSSTHTNYSLVTMNTPAVQYPGKDVLVAVLDTGFFIKPNSDGTTTSHEAYADNLESEGVSVTKYTKTYIDGKKATAGFNGKDAKRLNNKVPYYYDYGGANDDNSVDDTDVFDSSETHGTHVSTSIAGKCATYQGVAPYAQLALMKVSKDGIGAYETDILEALDDATKLGVDLITMSMGNDISDFAESAESGSAIDSTLDNLNDAGIIYDVSAGNNGKQVYQNTAGYAYNVPSLSQTGVTGNKTNDDRIMSIANATNDTYVASAVVFNNNYYDYTDPSDSSGSSVSGASMSTIKDRDLSYVIVPGNGEEKDYADIDVTGKVAVISRGDITFYLKVLNAQKHGAIAAVIYNNVDTDTAISMNLKGDGDAITIPSAFVSKRALADIVAGASSTMKIVINTPIDNYHKRRVSESSSDGSNSQLGIKPEIATPGTYCTAGIFEKDASGNYISTYADYTGTSMAAPNFAGSLALLLSQGISKDQILMKEMSTASVMVDKYGEKYSPRRQGAGLVDITKALNTKQYIEGSDSRNLISSLKKSTLKKSKIELGYSLDGKFELKFKVYNDSTASVTYTPSVDVMIPRTVDTKEVTDVYGNSSTEEVEGNTYQTAYDKTLRTFKAADVTVAGSSSVNVSISLALTDEEKTSIMNVFKNETEAVGTYIEGYVTLVPSDNSVATQINVPYMGFYGDFANADSIECFDFEHTSGQIYQSDLMNQFISKYSSDDSLGLSADYTSQWIVSGSVSSVDDVIKNKKSISTLGHSIGYDPSKGGVSYSNNEFYVGAPGVSDVMYIQQFVLGTVATNSVNIKNSQGQVIVSDHMYDALYSGSWNDTDGNETINSYRLNRSLASLDYFPYGESTYYAATRAYSIIPIYPFEKVKDSDGKEEWKRTGNYPDGVYTIDFDYTSEAAVSYGLSSMTEPTSTQHMSYTLHFDSVKPTLDSMEIVNKDGSEYLRVYGSDETALMYINVGGSYSSSIETDESGKKYADFKTSNFSSDKMNVSASDKAGNTATKSFYLSDVVDAKHTYSFDDNQAVISNDIDSSVTATLTSVDISEFEKQYTITFVKNGSTFASNESYKLVFRVGTSSNTDIELINAFYTDENGKLVQVDVTMNNGKIYIHIPSGAYTKIVYVDFNSLSGLFDGTYELAGMDTIITKVGTSYHYGED